MNFLKKNFSLFCIIFSLILLVYILYKSEIYWNGEKKKYYLNYYILVICFGFLSFLTVFLNEKIKEYLIISIISLYDEIFIKEKNPLKFIPFEKIDGHYNVEG